MDIPLTLIWTCDSKWMWQRISGEWLCTTDRKWTPVGIVTQSFHWERLAKWKNKSKLSNLPKCNNAIWLEHFPSMLTQTVIQNGFCRGMWLWIQPNVKWRGIFTFLKNKVLHRRITFKRQTIGLPPTFALGATLDCLRPLRWVRPLSHREI